MSHVNYVVRRQIWHWCGGASLQPSQMLSTTPEEANGVFEEQGCTLVQRSTFDPLCPNSLLTQQ
eukprot:4584283-Amphidinium_carterae.1